MSDQAVLPLDTPSTGVISLCLPQCPPSSLTPGTCPSVTSSSLPFGSYIPSSAALVNSPASAPRILLLPTRFFPASAPPFTSPPHYPEIPPSPPPPLGLQQVLYINFGTPSLFLPFTIRPPSRSHPPRMTPLQLRVPPFLSLSLYSSQGPASSSEPLPPLPVSSHPCQGPASPTGPLASVPGTCICLRDPHFTPSPPRQGAAPLSEAAHPRRGLHPLGKPPALPRSPHPRAGGRTSSAGCVLSTSTRHAGWQCSRRKW